ncbi:hypothetical protein Enr10x_23750 [Gimesia panareensis]|uniref:Lipoprotein n=1 Tax=Gimesia panareensis TaxID=2527978 RepID=A0A517Q5Y9_9PLAN|nr:hypothetical protein [Gimesia panareensis]QDT27061.1 hypothetical protein Enr10x_23750 [Gimesia panareensis]
MLSVLHQKHWKRTVLLICLLPCLFGCGSGSSESTTDPPIPEAEPVNTTGSGTHEPQQTAAGVKEFDGIQFEVPAGWKQVPLSPAQRGMISASFQIPEAGDGVRLTLSSVGGGVEANLERWRGQFQLPPGEKPIQKTIRVDGVETIWLDLRGTFDTGPSLRGAAESGMRMIGVAIPRSPRDFYLKLTGPREQLLKAEPEFEAFLKSARFKQ